MLAMRPGSQFTHFDYNPNVAANGAVIALFTIQFVAQIFQGVRYRTCGFMMAILIGLLLEIIGYTSRIFMHKDPSSRAAFLINNITLILGPACIAASIYLCTGYLVRSYGEGLSLLKPRTLFIIFVLCDLLNLVLQGIGGGVSSTMQTPSGIQAGINVVIAGLATQVTSLVLFVAYCSHFAWCIYRYPERKLEDFRSIRESSSFRLFLSSLSLATICIFVRSAFRIAELKEGFTGPLANSEIHFMVLECGMVLVATGVMTIAHPGRCLYGCWSTRSRCYENPFSLSESIHGWQIMYGDNTKRRTSKFSQDVKIVITSEPRGGIDN